MKPLPELLPDPQPATVTVTGAGLLSYCARATAGELHIYKLLTGRTNAEYVLHLLWLNGRTLYTGKLPGVTAPLPPQQRHVAQMQALELFQ